MKLNGLILAIVAYILGKILLPIFLLLGLVLSTRKTYNEYLLKIAISIDILGNVVGGPLLTRILVKSNDNPFGSITDTISYVIALNKFHKNLTGTGRLVANILDTLDPGHTDMVVQRAMKIKHCK